MDSLTAKSCHACKKGDPPLGISEANRLLEQLNGWSIDEGQSTLQRSITFKNYYETMAFVNAVAWIAHTEDHHPDMEVGYNRCVIHYSTHTVNGLSENDFICAAKIDALMPMNA